MLKKKKMHGLVAKIMLAVVCTWGGAHVAHAAHDYQWSDDNQSLTVNCSKDPADSDIGLITKSIGSENTVLNSITVITNQKGEGDGRESSNAIQNYGKEPVNIYAKKVDIKAGMYGVVADNNTTNNKANQTIINIGSENAVADNLTITMSQQSTNRAISSVGNSSLNIYSKNIELYTDSQGITANGNQKQGYESTAYVKIGSKNAYSDTLVIRGATDDTAASHGIAAFCNGNIDIYAKDIDIKANKYGIRTDDRLNDGMGNHINIHGENLKVSSASYAVYSTGKGNAINFGDNSNKIDIINLNGKNSLITNNLGIINVYAKSSTIEGSSSAVSNISGTINLHSDDLNIDGDIYNSAGNVDIKCSTGIIKGNISTTNIGGVSNISLGNKSDITTNNNDVNTTFIGKVTDTYNGKTNLSIYNKALWNMTDDSTFNSLNLTDGAIANLAYSDKYKNLSVNELSGNEGVFNLKINPSTNENNSDRIYVKGQHEGVHYITLDDIVQDGSYENAEGTVLVSVKNENGEFKANDSEGTLYWNTYELGRYDAANGDDVTENYETDWYLKKAEKVNKPTTGVDSVLSMNSLNYHTWRTENDKLLQRMGELRHNGEDEKGAWFRVKGSKIGYDGGFENKYTTYELGYDEVTKRTEDVVRYQGAALSYVDGKSNYTNGSGDNHGKSIGFYTTEQYSKGHYLDLVFKISNMDNDFKVFDTKGNKISGEYDNTGVSISAEYGRKNDLSNGWYIEPQAQLTLGYMGGARYETDNGIFVDQSSIKSALGRIGFNIGKQIGEKGIVYAKANLLHEFGGSYDVAMQAVDGSLTISNTYNDTWFEYGLGVALATSNNSHIYFDVERSTGSDFYKDWQWNAGMRWTF